MVNKTIEAINHIHVDHVNYDKTNYAIGWDDGEFSYHIWAQDQPGGTIYKNPLKTGLKTNDPGYFETRRLDSTKPRNLEILAYVHDRIAGEGLLEKAFADHDAKQAAEAAKNAELERLHDIAENVFNVMEERARLDIGDMRLTLEEMRALLFYKR